MAKKEYDPMEAMLVRLAGAEALKILNDDEEIGGVTKIFRSGDRQFRLRLSVVADKKDDEPSPFSKPNTNARSGMGLPKR